MILLSRRSLLAIAAVVDIALHARPTPVAAKVLASRHTLPPRHLETILQALVKAGLLKGRRATTHWQLMDALENDPEITALPDARYVRDGKIVTSQGVSAGMDMALWLVGQIHDPDHARLVRKILQYDPAPPYTAEV